MCLTRFSVLTLNLRIVQTLSWLTQPSVVLSSCSTPLPSPPPHTHTQAGHLHVSPSFTPAPLAFLWGSVHSLHHRVSVLTGPLPGTFFPQVSGSSLFNLPVGPWRGLPHHPSWSCLPHPTPGHLLYCGPVLISSWHFPPKI